MGAKIHRGCQNQRQVMCGGMKERFANELSRNTQNKLHVMKCIAQDLSQT